MVFKDVFVPVFGDAGDATIIQMLATAPVFAEGHMALCLMWPLPTMIYSGDGLMGGAAFGDWVMTARNDAQAAQAEVLSALNRTPINFEQRMSLGEGLTVASEAVMQARHADISVMTRPHANSDRLRHEILEAILMDSGRPLLLVPSTSEGPREFRNVFITWNASREAVRAIADASAFLTPQATIVVGTIDAHPSARGQGDVPGMDIAAHLARHGRTVELRNLDGGGDDKSTAIMKAAAAMDADLIIAGGYGHARLQQVLFGGVTRTLIDTSPIPLLLSH